MTDDDRPWLPCAVAEWFGVTEVTVRRWVRDGKLTRIDVGTLGYNDRAGSSSDQPEYDATSRGS